MTDDKTMLELADAATPGPWEAEDCEGELFVGAGDALTQWEETSSGILFGTPASSWKSTNRIYEHDLDTWDRGENADDDQRRADAEFIAAARSWVPNTLQRLEAIKALHRDAGSSQGYFDDGKYSERAHCCAECGTFGEYGVEWPCPTVKALGGVL